MSSLAPVFAVAVSLLAPSLAAADELAPLATVTTTTPSAPAAADRARDRGYLGVAGTIAGPLFEEDATIGVEAAIRIARSPFLVRAALGHGGRSQGLFEPQATLETARLGIEADACDSDRLVCGFVGGDVGVGYAVWDDMETDVTPIALGRLGVDIGGDYVRVRVAGELGTTAGGSVALAHRF